MSQKKVDQYKYEKAHRKEIMRKQRLMHTVRATVMGVVALALVGWLGFSAYDAYMDNQPREEVEVDYTSFDSYVQEISLSE